MKIVFTTTSLHRGRSVGPVGPVGLTGPTGEMGITGITGKGGFRGERGTTGNKGPIGEAGFKGPVGKIQAPDLIWKTLGSVEIPFEGDWAVDVISPPRFTKLPSNLVIFEGVVIFPSETAAPFYNVAQLPEEYRPSSKNNLFFPSADMVDVNNTFCAEITSTGYINIYPNKRFGRYSLANIHYYAGVHHA